MYISRMSYVIAVGGALSLGGFALTPAVSQTNDVKQEAEGNAEKLIDLAQKQPNSDFDEILKQLRSVVLTVQKKLNTKALPPLKSVEVDLQTGVTTTIGGQITIFVITIGASTANTTAQTMKFNLTPPKLAADQLAVAFTESKTPNFSAQFSAAIIAAAQAAEIALANAQKPALDLNSFTADIKFTIENTGQLGGNSLTFLPVNLQASAKIDPTTIHEAILTFAKPTPPDGH